MTSRQRLHRSRRHNVIAGVAGGMADSFGLPLWLVRSLWALLLLPGGLPGIIPYVLFWIAIPKR